MVRRDLPFNIFEDEDFIKSQLYIKNHLYIPTAYYVKKILYEYHPQLQIRLKHFLLSINLIKLIGLDKKLTIVLDGWSDRKRRSYLGITVHYYFKGNIGSVALGLVHIDREDGISIFKAIKKIIKFFEIQKKIQCIVTDSG